jgi:hypothetical protein
MRFTYASILCLIVAAFLPYTAAAAQISGGVDIAAARVAAERQLELASIEIIERLLSAAKIDPGAAAIQRGARNYAGADCPGADWNCTTATVVVQIGRANASNQFDCDPASAGTNPLTNTCVAIQLVPAGEKGNNQARCRIRGSESPQSCTIDQTNLGGGSNHAQTDMLIDMRGGSSQSGTQNATVRQRTSTGDNHSHLTQSIRLVTDDVSATLTQTQLGIQTAVVCQGGPLPVTPACPTTATDGSNFSHVDQSLSLRATATGGTAITQNQNITGGTDVCTGTLLVSPTAPNTAADIDQLTTGGKNHSSLKQSNDLDGRVRDVPGFSVDQTQGNAAGGLEGCVNQTAGSTGFSTSHASQSDSQTLKGPPGANQNQFGPEFCCTTQIGPGTVNIDQRKSQSSTSSTQFGLVSGTCSTPDGQCDLDQRASNNVDSERNSCTGTFCAEVVTCTSFTEEEGEGPPISGGDCTTVVDEEPGLE